MRSILFLVVAAVLTAGCARSGSAQTEQRRRGDPGMRVAGAIVLLQRSEQHQFTPDQARKILPLLKVLRDTKPADREASRALADQILNVFTPAQRQAMDDMRRERRERFRRLPSEGSSPGAEGPGRRFDPARRGEFRRRAIDRAVLLLEARAKE